MENSKQRHIYKQNVHKIILDGNDVTPRPLYTKVRYTTKKPEAPKYVKVKERKRVRHSESSSEAISSVFRLSLSSPVDVGIVERPYSNSVMENFKKRFLTPPPEEVQVDVPKEKVSQERIAELMECKPTPTEVILSLKETPTFFLLERPSLTAVPGSEEAEMILKDNEYYEYLVSGEGRRRHTKDAEVQTKWTMWKTKATMAPAPVVKDNIAVASTYDLYNSFNGIKNNNKETKERDDKISKFM